MGLRTVIVSDTCVINTSEDDCGDAWGGASWGGCDNSDHLWEDVMSACDSGGSAAGLGPFDCATLASC